MAKTAVRALGLLAAGLLAVVLAYRAGPPAGSLPDSALGWELLLYVERAAARLAIVGATALIAVRAAGGTFPRIFGPVEYELAKAAADEAEAISAEQELRIRRLEVLAGLRDVDQLRDPQEGLE